MGENKYSHFSNDEKRRISIEDYYKKPNYCLQCGKIIEIKDKQRISDIRMKKFCDQSCAATYNNKKFPKRVKNKYNSKNYNLKYICPQCNGKKAPQSKICHNCKKNNYLKYCLSSKMSNYFNNGNARIKYIQIRKWAKMYLDYINRPKKCIICGYDNPKVLEVSHIKDISSFPEDSLMSEVNGSNNLEYMCPTHHAEFDKGFLDIEKYRSVILNT